MPPPFPLRRPPLASSTAGSRPVSRPAAITGGSASSAAERVTIAERADHRRQQWPFSPPPPMAPDSLAAALFCIHAYPGSSDGQRMDRTSGR
ncbi:hypothetical protein U9M48_025746 [Paspalum notatum var. saurae]|uniref:Uncharacterized protein n=1 Tax=Paspalum notatum var. saurae TaxID=547442 RepID=A0AAQ3TRD4_PASNO